MCLPVHPTGLVWYDQFVLCVKCAYPCSTLAKYGMTSLCWLFLVFTMILPNHCLGCNAFTAGRQTRPRWRCGKTTGLSDSQTKQLHGYLIINSFGLLMVDFFLSRAAEDQPSPTPRLSSTSSETYIVHIKNLIYSQCFLPTICIRLSIRRVVGAPPMISQPVVSISVCLSYS